MKKIAASEELSKPANISASEIMEVRRFLARVVRTPITSIRLTGDPATDTNGDLVRNCVAGPKKDWQNPRLIEKLDAMEAIRIDIAFQQATSPVELAEAISAFNEFLDTRVPFYQ